MRRLNLFLALAFQVGTVFGQLVELSGVVLDNGTSEPIPFAKVYLEDRTRGALTNEEGRFTIDRLPLGAHVFIVEAMGYVQTRMEGMEVRPGKQWVEFRLVEQELIGGPPVITAKRRPWPWRWFKR